MEGWRKNNVGHEKEYRKKYIPVYYQKNKDKLKIRNKEHYYANKDTSHYKELRKKRDKVYRQKHKKKVKERYKKWIKKNPIKTKIYSHKRRTLKKCKIGSINENQIKKIFKRDKFCIYCNSDKDLALDHIIPLTHKLSNSLYYNYVIACKSCNSSKGNKNVFDWCYEKKSEVPDIVINLLNKQLEELGKQTKLTATKGNETATTKE